MIFKEEKRILNVLLCQIWGLLQSHSILKSVISNWETHKWNNTSEYTDLSQILKYAKSYNIVGVELKVSGGHNELDTKYHYKINQLYEEEKWVFPLMI